ncbi:MAG: hypothetical protein ABI155_04965 [Paralcaligenes sp.]
MTISLGLPGGPTAPVYALADNPFTPASAMVGTSGSNPGGWAHAHSSMVHRRAIRY